MPSTMPVRYDILHTTIYRYAEPVTFNEHRVMFRPRDSHDQRVLATDLQVSPAATIRLIQDPHSNSVALVTPNEPAAELSFVCSFTIEYVESPPGLNPELNLSPSAELYPFAYTVDERFDLEHYLRPHHDDPEGRLTKWARQFLSTDGQTGTRDMLVKMNQHIRQHFAYAARDEEGTQTPLQTLESGSGSCRDFALLMMEAVRQLGIATRFVSGYLYDPSLDTANAAGAADAVANPAAAHAAEPPVNAAATVGAGATHAWLEAYLPGAGWVTFDPTNNLLGGNRLIRVGVARDPRQASPISGSWFGAANAYVGMTATVQVTRTAAA